MPEMVSRYASKPVLVPEALVARYVEAGFAVVEQEPEKAPEKKPTARKRRSSDS